MSTSTAPALDDVAPGFAPYRKWVAALLTALGVSLWAAYTDDVVTWAEITGIGIAGFNIIAVEAIPNAREGVAKAAKFIAAAVSTVLIAVSQVAFDGAFTSQDTMFVLLAALGALGVYQAPNNPLRGR